MDVMTLCRVGVCMYGSCDSRGNIDNGLDEA